MSSAAAGRAGRLGEWVTVQVFRAGWRGVRLLPQQSAYRLFDGIAELMVRRDGKGVRRMRANYALVRPELDTAALQQLTRRGVRSYLRYWCESFRLPDLDAAELRARVRTEGDRPVREALGTGQGVVCFLGHLGNWDSAGAWATHHLAPVTTVAERLKPEELYDQFVAYRERLGMTILPLTGGAPPFRQLVRTLRAGGFVPLLADRDLTASGVRVRFCDQDAQMAAGPAALALATGAPLVPVATLYEPDPSGGAGTAAYRLLIRFGDPVRPTDPAAPRQDQIRDLTQQCADFLALHVREHTEDWHMMQRVFVPAAAREVAR